MLDRSSINARAMSAWAVCSNLGSGSRSAAARCSRSCIRFRAKTALCSRSSSSSVRALLPGSNVARRRGAISFSRVIILMPSSSMRVFSPSRCHSRTESTLAINCAILANCLWASSSSATSAIEAPRAGVSATLNTHTSEISSIRLDVIIALFSKYPACNQLAGLKPTQVPVSFVRHRRIASRPPDLASLTRVFRLRLDH